LTTFQAILTLDKFPHTVGTYLQYSDINSEQSGHVETVVLLSKLNAKEHITVDLDRGELDATATG